MAELKALPTSTTPLRKRRCLKCKKNFFSRDMTVRECQNCTDDYDRSEQIARDAEMIAKTRRVRENETAQATPTPNQPAKPKKS